MYVALDFATSNKDCINSEAAMASTPVSLHIGGTAQQREPLRRIAFLEPVAKDTPGAQARYTAAQDRISYCRNLFA
jgi:hypothetical protein